MDAAWALYEAWVKLQYGEIDTALVYGFGKSSQGDVREIMTLQLDPYYLAPLGPALSGRGERSADRKLVAPHHRAAPRRHRDPLGLPLGTRPGGAADPVRAGGGLGARAANRPAAR